MLVKQQEFYQRLNERVFVPHLGRDLSFNEARDLVHGMADVVFEIGYAGNSVRFGRLGMFYCHTTPAGMRWDPARQRKFEGSERRKLAFRQSKSSRELFG